MILKTTDWLDIVDIYIHATYMILAQGKAEDTKE